MYQFLLVLFLCDALSHAFTCNEHTVKTAKLKPCHTAFPWYYGSFLSSLRAWRKHCHFIMQPLPYLLLWALCEKNRQFDTSYGMVGMKMFML